MINTKKDVYIFDENENVWNEWDENVMVVAVVVVTAAKTVAMMTMVEGDRSDEVNLKFI